MPSWPHPKIKCVMDANRRVLRLFDPMKFKKVFVVIIFTPTCVNEVLILHTFTCFGNISPFTCFYFISLFIQTGFLSSSFRIAFLSHLFWWHNSFVSLFHLFPFFSYLSFQTCGILNRLLSCLLCPVTRGWRPGLQGFLLWRAPPARAAVNTTVTSQWARWRLKSPTSRLFTQAFIQAQMKESIEVPRHWPLWGEFTNDRWIPRTKDQ